MIKLNFIYLFFSLSLISSHYANAQQLEGRIRYLTVSNWTKRLAAVDYISKQQKERNAYVWGNRSENKSYTELYFSNRQTKFIESDESPEIRNESWKNRKEDFFIVRNFEKNTMVEVEELNDKTYIIEDTLLPPSWKILNDIKEVAGHVCMNAEFTDTIKNQHIIAWFALDLPQPIGPERLFGLPGIILEADYNDGGKTLTADLIDLKKITTELAPPKKIRGKHIRQSEYIALVKNQIADAKKLERAWFWNMRY